MANKNFIVKNGITLEGYGEIIDSAGNWTGVAISGGGTVDSAQVLSIVTADGFTKLDSANVSSIITADVDATFINALTIDADTLGSQAGSYYLDYTNFTNTPNILDSANVIATITADGFTKFDSANASGLITTAINNLVDAAPAALDTLNELAAALGDDANFSTTVTNAIAALPDSAEVVTLINNTVDATFINALTIDADTLGSQAGSYYLDYNNFTNTPNILDSANVTNLIDSDYINTRVDATGTTWSVKTANYTASSGEGIIADTSGGTFTITLPATPTTGDNIIIADGADWAITNLTVERNGSTIEGEAENLLLDVGQIQVQFIYDGTTWEVYTFAGGTIPIQADDNTTDATKYITWNDSSGGVYNPKVSSTKLYFNPSTGTLNATDFNALSDQRLKENIQDLTINYDMLNSIQGVSFNWKDNGKSAYGFIAQDLEEVLPELVAENKDNSYKSVSYIQLIPHLLEAVKDLKKRIDDIEEKN